MWCLHPNIVERSFFGEKKAEIGKILRTLCEWKGVNIVEAVQFYEKLSYAHVDDSVVRSGVFDCIRMRKSLPAR